MAIDKDREFLNSYLHDDHEVYTDSISSKTLNEEQVYDVTDGTQSNQNIFEDNRKQIEDLKKQFTPHYAQQDKKPKRLISKIFSNLSRFGMNYEDDVIGNMRALPADPKLLPKPDQLYAQDMFNQISSKWQVKTNQEKNFFEKDLPVKREALRKLALQPELEDILDTMTNECIVYDSDYSYFAEPFLDDKILKDYKETLKKKISDSMISNYYKFYKMLNWKYNAWDDFKRFLIEGSLAWEIVYDNLEHPRRVIGLVPVDAATLTKVFDKGKIYWVQFKGIQGKERKLLDAQIIYIQYQENVVARQSYLERLIRPYNIYRIIEQAQIIWTITNSSYKMKFTIPVNGLSKPKATQTLRSAMNRYKEDIKFNTDTGELQVNSQTTLPFNKEYWLPATESGTPEIDTLGTDGPDLNDNDQLKYFRLQLYKISKIPVSRFDNDNQPNFFGSDVTAMARDEINFARFVTRLRNIFSKIIIKPLQLQLALDVPELQKEREILDAIQLRYTSYNLFEEMMEQDLMQKRVEFIQTMKDSLVDQSPDGAEVKYFSSEWLVRKYLKLSDAELKLNQKYSNQELEKAKEMSKETGNNDSDDSDDSGDDYSRGNNDSDYGGFKGYESLDDEKPLDDLEDDDNKVIKKPTKKKNKKKLQKNTEEE